MSLIGQVFDKSVDKDLLDSFGVPIGDTERVLAVAFHPTKQYVAFGCENSCVKLWNLRTKLYVSIVPHPGRIHTLAFSQDGSLLCSASSGHTEGNTMNLWECVYDVKNEEDITLKLLLSDCMLAVNRLEILHQDTITSCCFMPPRNMKDTPHLVASGSKDTTVRIWCFPAKHRMTRQVLRNHTHPVNCVAFSDDGKYLASGDESVSFMDIGHRYWMGSEALLVVGVEGLQCSACSLYTLIWSHIVASLGRLPNIHHQLFISRVKSHFSVCITARQITMTAWTTTKMTTVVAPINTAPT